MCFKANHQEKKAGEDGICWRRGWGWKRGSRFCKWSGRFLYSIFNMIFLSNIIVNYMVMWWLQVLESGSNESQPGPSKAVSNAKFCEYSFLHWSPVLVDLFQTPCIAWLVTCVVPFNLPKKSHLVINVKLHGFMQCEDWSNCCIQIFCHGLEKW